MSVPREPGPALLFTSVLFSRKVNPCEIVTLMAERIGAVRLTSLLSGFVWTDYYQDEMGPDLKRIFIVYDGLTGRDGIVGIKKMTDGIEEEFSERGKRTVNIDPGLVTPENIVLATNKPFFHRVYLSRGVYAEVTLFYKNGTYNPVDYWTFPEYRSNPVIMFFNQARSCLRN
ncbi:MAG: DUF4416 family protein [Oligoflexia bacterium]|nr:DUF4416 family protein [Oligoflexia bacterium]